MMADKEIFYCRQGTQTAIKISNFTPIFRTLDPPCSQTPPPSVSPSDRKRPTLSSSSHHRKSPTQQTSPLRLRALHTSHLSRHPLPSPDGPTEAKTISRYKQELPLSHNQPQGHNIRQLREVMKERIAAFKEMAAQQNSFHFKEYKMKPIERDKWNRTTLHSRRITDSPFLKALKPKKMVSAELPSNNTSEMSQAQQEGRRKMVLVGGSIPVRSISSNPEQGCTFSPLKSARKQLTGGYVGGLRRNHQHKQNEVAERYENDCKPWEDHRGEALDESNHFCLFAK